jgi:hypothetical protein
VAGDAWLEARGRRPRPGLDARQGRRGLFEVLQQGSNPYEDGERAEWAAVLRCLLPGRALRGQRAQRHRCSPACWQ